MLNGNRRGWARAEFDITCGGGSSDHGLRFLVVISRIVRGIVAVPWTVVHVFAQHEFHPQATRRHRSVGRYCQRTGQP
jgi:hypothetical protein